MRRAPSHAVLHVLFFCSGASGLIYEVVWVREFGNIFGNTVYSAALVVAVFMLGLGAGGYAVGRWADHRDAERGPSLVKTYGCFELGIGLWGLLMSLLLPYLGAFSALISTYVRDPGGWYAMSATSYLWRYVMAVILVGPATFFMGGALAGVGSLYSREFYELVRSRLRPGGFVTQWLPVVQVPPETTLAMIGAFVAVFPQAVLLSGADAELILMGVNGGRIEIDPAQVAVRLREAPAVQRDLDRVDLGTVTEIVGTFVASAGALAEASRLVPAATDDRPIQEYGARSRFSPGRAGAPLSIFRVDGVSAWCPKCLAGGRTVPPVEGLDIYLTILDVVYRDPAFRQRGLRLPEGRRAQEVIGKSSYLRGVIERARDVGSRPPPG